MGNFTVAEAKAIRSAAADATDIAVRRQAATLRIGDQVEWDSKRGYCVRGTITKMCPKNFKVREDGSYGTVWTVWPGFLRKAS